jgi:hypothetical protein
LFARKGPDIMHSNVCLMTHEDNLAQMEEHGIGKYIDSADFDEEIVRRIALAMEFKTEVWKLANWILDGAPIVTTGGPNRYGDEVLVRVELPELDEDDEEEVEDDDDYEMFPSLNFLRNMGFHFWQL